MNTTQTLIQQAKQMLGIESDYGLAKRLKWSRQAVSNYQRGERHLDVDACFDVAELLGKDPAAIIAAVEAERATKPEAREAWIQRLKQLGGVAATVVIGMSGALPAPADAATQQQLLPHDTVNRLLFSELRTAMLRLKTALRRSRFAQFFSSSFAAPALA